MDSASQWQPPANWQSRPVCVLGGGVLGRRIAACFVAAGHLVRIRDPSQASRDGAIDFIKNNIAAFTALSGKEPGTCEAFVELPDAVKDCWLVFEAVPEILSLKENTFADLEKYAPDDCILASNSSSYKSGELAGKIKDSTKARVLNTHFMMPPDAIIVELMTCGGYTAEGIFPFLIERHKEAGLHPIVALKESTGFVFNRIWAAVKREVLSVLAEGVATAETIDSVWIEQFGQQKIGPCKLMDSVGLDTVAHIEEHYIEDRHLPNSHLGWLKDNFISSGKIGVKSGKGGLYPPPTPGHSTKILLLNVGLAASLKGKTLSQIVHSGQVLVYDVQNEMSRPIELVGKLPIPDGIDIAQSTQRMYWTNMGNIIENSGSIQSANLDGSDVQYVLKPGTVHTPKQLVIDQEQSKIYFCDREGLRVMRVNLDGSDLETLYQSGDWSKEPAKRADATFWPVGIAISKKLNKFFWTQKGRSKANEGRIFAASLNMPNGTTSPADRPDVEVIIDKLPECIDLEFDDDECVLYWTDRGEVPFGNTLNKKHIVPDGKPLDAAVVAAERAMGREIIAQGLNEGIGLKLDKENKCLYVTDMGGNLWKCSTNGGPKQKMYEGPDHTYTGLTFYRY